MRFSLIMATRGRVEEVGRFLQSLSEQDHQAIELIVVDQNADDRLVELINAHRQHFPIRHITRAKPGASRSRNEGLSHVNGDIVGFPDDDCVYPLGFLGKVAHFFQSEKWDGLSVRILDLDRDEDAFGFSEPSSGSIDYSNAWGVGITPALFFRRSVAERVAFDEAIGPGSGQKWGGGEDTDYLLSCLDSGASHYYERGLFVRHPAPRRIYSVVQLMRREYSYGRGFAFLMVKRAIPWPLARMQLHSPFALAANNLLAGNLRDALVFLAMGLGRVVGYWKSVSPKQTH